MQPVWTGSTLTIQFIVRLTKSFQTCPFVFLAQKRPNRLVPFNWPKNELTVQMVDLWPDFSSSVWPPLVYIA